MMLSRLNEVIELALERRGNKYDVHVVSSSKQDDRYIFTLQSRLHPDIQLVYTVMDDVDLSTDDMETLVHYVEACIVTPPYNEMPI